MNLVTTRVADSEKTDLAAIIPFDSTKYEILKMCKFEEKLAICRPSVHPPVFKILDHVTDYFSARRRILLTFGKVYRTVLSTIILSTYLKHV